MKNQGWQTGGWHGIGSVALLAMVFTLGGCASNSSTNKGSGWMSTGQSAKLLTEANQAYDREQYVTAYRKAIQVANREHNPDRFLAAYIAGMSTMKLRDHPKAVFYLDIAKQSSDRQLAADAEAALGLNHAQMGKHDLAIRELLNAAPGLQGNDKANAYLFAAISQQKLGRRSAARTNLLLASQNATDPALRQQINQLLGVTGYTLQTGAFTKENNARTAAQKLAGQARPLNMGQARILVITQNGRKFYRVQIGRFTSFDSANRSRNDLRNRTGVSSIIVPLSG